MYRKREELAWAAGLFDGEGYVGATRYRERYMKLTLSIHQSGTEDEWPDVLERFIHVLDIGTIYGPMEKSGKGEWRVMWTYVTHTFEDTQFVIASLWPWLGKVKKEQAYQAAKKYLEWYPTVNHKPGKKRVS